VVNQGLDMIKKDIRQERGAAFVVIIGMVLALTQTGGIVMSQEKSVQQMAVKALDNIPVSSIERAEKDGTAYHVSLTELTKLALRNNLDIAISDTNEELYQAKILQAHGPYDPAISFALNLRDTTQPNTNLTVQASGNSNFTKTDTWNFQFNQNVATGGSLVASLQSNRTDTNQIFALINPQYNTTSSIQFTQPLLRNRHIDQNRGTIKIANLDLKINDSQFKQTVTNTIATIQGVYWDLVYAIQNYDFTRQSVKLAQITVDQNREKVRIGTASPMDVTVAQATVASRMVDLISAQQTINIAENNLISTISNDHKSDLWQKVIVPTDSADFVAYKADLNRSIDAALRYRPELEQYDLQMQENDVSYAVDKNQKKWQLDAVGSFGTVGVAGPQSYTYNALTQNETANIPNSLVGGIGTAYQTLFSQGFMNWMVGVNIQIPLRNRSLEGQLGQLQVQKKQLLMNRKSQEQKIAVQIRNAVDDLESNKQKVETAKVARQLAEAQLDAENKRFQAGMSSNFLILQRQNDLFTAQAAELQASVAYKKAIITLQQDEYTLLQTSDFEIVGKGAGAPKLK